MKNFRLRLLAALTLAVILPTSGLVWNGYAGIEGQPEGVKLIRRPYLRGTLLALFVPADPDIEDDSPKAVFAFTGQCRSTGGPDQPVELGPIIEPEFLASFFDPKLLEGQFFSRDRTGVPPCFAESGPITGWVISKVRRFTAQGPNIFIAEVEISAQQ
jgi:hypothetical protein